MESLGLTFPSWVVWDDGPACRHAENVPARDKALPRGSSHFISIVVLISIGIAAFSTVGNGSTEAMKQVPRWSLGEQGAD